MSSFLYHPLFLFACLAIAAVIAWFAWFRDKWAQRKLAKAGGKDVSDGHPHAVLVRDVRSLLRAAERELKRSTAMRGATLRSAPVFLIVGPPGAGKTHLIEHSGLTAEEGHPAKPERLSEGFDPGMAGGPKTPVHVWLARRTVWIELSSDVIASPDALQAVASAILPGRIASAFRRKLPARAIVLCMNLGLVPEAQPAGTHTTRSDRPQTAGDTKENLSEWCRRGLISLTKALGVRLPTYCVFTQFDRPQEFGREFEKLGRKFKEFVVSFNRLDLKEPFGATIQPYDPARGGFAAETAKRLSDAFGRLFYALSDSRIHVLAREQSLERIRRQYLFPREFEKLGARIIQFLLTALGPSQRHDVPFLRGFYFSGVRKVRRELPPDLPTQPQREDSSTDAEGEASRFNYSEKAPASQPPPAPRVIEESQSLFTIPFLEEVLLKDDAPSKAGAKSGRAGIGRVALLGLATLLGLGLLGMLTFSHLRNRSLAKDLAAAAQPGGAETLQRMREPLERLLDYRAAPPLTMRWALWKVPALTGPAQAAYCSTMRNVHLDSVYRALTARVAAIGQNSRGDASEEFRHLKAFMMLTSHPANADETFLAAVVLDQWKSLTENTGRPEAGSLPAQLRLYGKLLPIADSQAACVFPARREIVARAQGILQKLDENDRYRSLLHAAGRGLDDVDYNARYSNNAVSDEKVVPGWFTHKGWTAMQALLDHPEESLRADAWVLGEPRDLTREQLTSMAAKFRARYRNEYEEAWKQYLKSARIASYANLADAVGKLEKMSGQESFLLNLIGLAAEHISFDPMKDVFGPVLAVTPGPGNFRPAANYLRQLNVLKNSLHQVGQATGQARDADVQKTRDAATQASNAVGELALDPGFKGAVDGIVKNDILLAPITQIEGLLRSESTAAIGQGARSLCNSANLLARSLPFSLSTQEAGNDEVHGMFALKAGQETGGQVSQFYSQSLTDVLTCGPMGCTRVVNNGRQITPVFQQYVSSLFRWSGVLYGNPTAQLLFRAPAWNHVKRIEIEADGQRVVLEAGNQQYKQVSWDFRRLEPLRLQVFGVFDGEDETQTLFTRKGKWAIFAWLHDAESGSGAAGYRWIPRSGNRLPDLLKNGRTKDYKLEVVLSDFRPFDLSAMALSPCRLPTGK